jgi:HK97 family phage portal protein
MLTKIRSQIRAGLRVEQALAASRGAGAKTFTQPPFWASSGVLGSLLPGSRKSNWAQEAGPLWLNGIVLTAEHWKGCTFQEAPLTVYRRVKGEEKPEAHPDHPALALLEEPNPWWEGGLNWTGAVLSVDLDGNGYWHKLRNTGRRLTGYQYVPHTRVMPHRQRGERPDVLVSHYKVRVDGETQEIPPADILHFRGMLPDPENDLKSLSRLAAELRSICTDNELATFHQRLLAQMGVAAAVLSPKDMPDGAEVAFTKEQREELKRIWGESITGDNRGLPLVASVPLEIQNPGLSPRDLEASIYSKLVTPRICAALGLDPMVLGLPSETKTYSNYQEAREAAYESCIIPTHAWLDRQLSKDLRKEGWLGPEESIGRDYSNVRVLQPDLDKQYQRITAAVGTSWLTVNEAREEIGRDSIPGGDVLQPKEGSTTPTDGDQDGAIQEGEPGSTATEPAKAHPAALFGAAEFAARQAARRARLATERAL